MADPRGAEARLLPDPGHASRPGSGTPAAGYPAWSPSGCGRSPAPAPIPLHELPGRLPELPDGPVSVHCQGGYRASIAASLLQAAGYAVTAVDDDFSRAAAAGLAITGRSGPAPAAAAPPR